MRFLIAISVFFILAPGVSFAHATPVEMLPASGSRVENVNHVQIRFSERIEDGSRIQVKFGDTAVETDAAEVGEDPHVLSVPVLVDENGVYIVSWSVVSKDDGHFTKGSFAFSRGTDAPVSTATDTSVVQISTIPEALGMTVEFIGNSLLWGILLFALIAWRVRDKHSHYFKKLSTWFVFSGTLLIVSGGVFQILWKASELAQLHAISFSESLPLYVATTAGSSTLWRALAALTLGAMFTFSRRRFTVPVLALSSLCLLGFAYFRAIVSHATANPFFPEFSVLVNILHLIEKDLWLGILLVMAALLLTRGKEILEDTFSRIQMVLAGNLALISLSASYIIWLHLRSFHNISSTTWGGIFIHLLTAAVLLVCMRAYHTLVPSIRVSKLFSITLGIEIAAALLVIFYTSLIIITSPPLETARVFSYTQDGYVIQLQASPYEDAMLLTTSVGVSTLTAMLGEGEGALLVALTERFPGGYVFPKELITRETTLRIVASRPGAYDATVQFVISPEDGEPHGRTLDRFAITMIGFALMGCAFGLFLRSRSTATLRITKFNSAILLTVLLVALSLGVILAQNMNRVFGNSFKEACIRDGNMWHLMLPTKAGRPVSSTPREGCMLMAGLYHISDAREYEYLRTLPPLSIAFDPKPVAGVATTLHFNLKESDGSAPTLSVIHEKLVHVVIVSADMTEFVHIHPEDVQDEGEDLVQGMYKIQHTFPKAGTYLVALDYLHGLTQESKTFIVTVSGAPAQAETKTFETGSFDGYDVTLDSSAIFAGEVANIRYMIKKNGVPVLNLEPYLAAAMHIAVVKNDLSKFIHTHGEVHPPGYVAPTTISHNHAPPPAQFGPIVEGHMIFPEPGVYTLFGEFKHDGKIIVTKFTVRVE